jgi:transcriptional regulator with XRE-family HTH domain
MPPNAFSTALTMLRERRTLSGRELSKLADVDHAYESRLESGDKENPSDDTIEKLLRGLKLKASDRDAQILKYTAKYPQTWSEFVAYCLGDPTVTMDEFTMGAGMMHRGEKPSPTVIIERVRRVLSEDPEGE